MINNHRKRRVAQNIIRSAQCSLHKKIYETGAYTLLNLGNTFGLPTKLQDIPETEMLMTFIAQDKKISKNSLTIILTCKLNQLFIAKHITPNVILNFLKQKLMKTR